ncbi:MAG: tetratricopeptide repeat protein [Azospirillaceae bacterium]|nr:tetratricopeptide repeat protein [Azospirillaceae bacterium]
MINPGRQARALVPHPDDALTVLFARAVARQAVDEHAEAIALYRQLIALSPMLAEVYVNLGQSLAACGAMVPAGDALRDAVVLAPADPRFLYALAEILVLRGRVRDAINAYRRAVRARPDFAQAWGHLGLALGALNQPTAAIIAYRHATALLPDAAEAHFNLGNSLAGQRRFAEALMAYWRTVVLEPGHHAARHNLGNALRDLDRLEVAVVCFGLHIARQPNFLPAYTALSQTLLRLDQRGSSLPQSPLAPARHAYHLRPDDPTALTALGNALKAIDQLAPARAAFRQAIAMQPDEAETYSNLAFAEIDGSAHDAAVVACRRALILKPDHAEALNNFGKARQAQCAAGIPFFRHAVTSRPDHDAAYNNLGNALAACGDFAGAMVAYHRAQRSNPAEPRFHVNRALTLLRYGYWREGWAEYEWRWKTRPFIRAKPAIPTPEWRGEPLAGRTVLLYAEQGHGDAIQFTRFAPMVAARGGRVVLSTFADLVRLLQTAPGVDAVARFAGSLPAHDCHLPLMSVPHVLGIDIADAAVPVPYLRATPDAAAAWRIRLAGLPGLKAGLVWAGDPRPFNREAHQVDSRRSMTLGQFAPLGTVTGLTLISLQKGAPAAEAATTPPGLRLYDWMEEINDFADTAALIENLDLVITVDTAVAHLAGALGKPVWILSRWEGCWRWLRDRDDTPWYPSARLFRQRRPGDWGEVVTRVAAAVAERVAITRAAR